MSNRFCRLISIHDGHTHIQNHNVRLQYLHFFDGDFAVLGLAADLPVLAGKDLTHASADDFVIVNNQYSQNETAQSGDR